MAIDVDVDDGVAVVTLDWPERRNAMGPVEARALAEVFTAVGRRDDVRIVVITGRGAFSAGGDLPAIVEMVDRGKEAVAEALYTDFHALMRALVWMPKPTLAAIDGPAVGLGMDLALACDWRAIGSDGWLLQGWARIGLIPGTGGELILRRLAPSLIWSILGSSNPIRPAQVDEWGLAHAVDGRALPVAMEHARTLARIPHGALEAYVSLHRSELREQLDEHLSSCLTFQVELLCSQEFRTKAAEVMRR